MLLDMVLQFLCELPVSELNHYATFSNLLYCGIQVVIGSARII